MVSLGVERASPAVERTQVGILGAGPAGLVLDQDMRQFAQRLGIDAEAEFEAWRDDCAAHDRRYADWRAAWRGRCRNALRFGGAGARRGVGQSAMEMALRRLREASERERSGDAS